MVLSLKGVSLIDVSLTEINLIRVSPRARDRERERERVRERRFDRSKSDRDKLEDF